MPSPQEPTASGGPHVSGHLHADLLDTIGTRIASGELAVGSVQTLDGIARDHAVSHSVAREAVRVLESMGLLTSRRRVGLTVMDRSQWNAFDPRLIRWRLAGADREHQLASLNELRRGFEPAAAALAASRIDDAQAIALADAVRRMHLHGRTGDLEAYLAADIDFHRTLLGASGNEMLRALSGVVDEILAGRTRHRLMPARPNPAAIALHDQVARAVRIGDPEGAESAMREIIAEAAAAAREADRSQTAEGREAPKPRSSASIQAARTGTRGAPASTSHP